MRKIGGGSTTRKSPIGSGQQDVGHSGVATGRGAFNLSSSISMGDGRKLPLMEASLYPTLMGSNLHWVKFYFHKALL
ncbi:MULTISPECIES: hypothetical protein [Rummeliibacillus]|uniref:hypothetical protein n=1 Tax=Rummeliibacillus TaxID=648802 RepID=UPI0011B79F52|nr:MULTISPECIES: hypothetical protein [Rummeliibacillus]